jgi:hypothetical protein
VVNVAEFRTLKNKRKKKICLVLLSLQKTMALDPGILIVGVLLIVFGVVVLLTIRKNKGKPLDGKVGGEVNTARIQSVSDDGVDGVDGDGDDGVIDDDGGDGVSGDDGGDGVKGDNENFPFANAWKTVRKRLFKVEKSS